MSAVAENLPAVPEVDVGVFGDRERFRCEVVERCQPVIVRGAFSDWPVVRAAGISPGALRSYLGRFANAMHAEAFVGDPSIAGRYSYAEDLDGFNFDRVEIDLLGALDRILASASSPGSSTVYIGSLETDTHLPGFSGENRVAILPSSITPRIWIGNASLVSCHNDTFDNIACVIAGRRRFTLYPPDTIGDLYIGPIDYTMSGRPISLAAGSAPGEPRYPRFAAAAARAMVADLLPGDALYLPKLWWHQVEATEPFNILINY